MLRSILPRCLPRYFSSSNLRNPAQKQHLKTHEPTQLQAAVLDWSGTCADNFVIAPAAAFVESFKAFGINVSMKEARVPMGLRKDLHIKALMEIPEIRDQWTKKYQKKPDDEAVAKVFERFVPIQLECLPKYTGLIPGTAEAVKTLKDKYKLKIGNTTGFQRVMVDILLRDAAKQGYVPDCSVAGDETEFPRPYPYMVFRNMEKLGIKHTHAVVKVDDTVGGVLEGVNAGCWSVAVSHTSNYMNISTMEEYKQMSKEEVAKRGKAAREILIKTGCHYVVDDITFLPAIVEDINKRMGQGEKP